MFEVREEKGSCCFPREVVWANAGLGSVDGIIGILAFSQLMRIHARNSQLGWTRQKRSINLVNHSYWIDRSCGIGGWTSDESIYVVLHLLIGSSNAGYLFYFVIALIATCKRWRCWSYSCGFILMAFPKILSFAAFLLLLSFWVDLCHQAVDEDYEEEDFNSQEALLEIRFDDPSSAHADSSRACLPLRSIHVGSRQKVVILVTALVFALMIISAVLIWIGMGNNFIDSSLLATVYVDVFALIMLLLGGALAFYGLLLCLKMRRVRYERTESEMWKVAGLAVVSVLCFTSSAFIAFFTQIPVLYYCQQLDQNGVYTSLLLILYYFIGSSVPSAFVLWIMRELPAPAATNVQSRIITFVSDSSAAVNNPPRWTTVASLQNQISRGSPI